MASEVNQNLPQDLRLTMDTPGFDGSIVKVVPVNGRVFFEVIVEEKVNETSLA